MKNEKIATVNTRNFQQEILDCINLNNFGVTIQDIADQIKASRNTVSKYIFQLEHEKKIFKKKVGVYFLYFSTDRELVQRSIIDEFYKSFLLGLKMRFPDEEKTFKIIGRDIGENFMIPLDYIRGLYKESQSPRDIPTRTFLEILREFLPYIDIFQHSLEISIIDTNEQGNKATYRLSKSNLLEKTKDFIYHFYIISGMIETTLARELMREVTSDVVQINISNENAKSFVDISVEIVEK
jgi:hypothetical protein